MKIRFNKFEKVAGLFVGGSILACVVGLSAIAVKNGWLALKDKYVAELESGDGVHAGTSVQMSGLRVGSVSKVELDSNDKVRIEFQVLEKFAHRIRKDSRVNIYRPFILGDKVLDITVGTEHEEMVGPGEKLPVSASYDVMDLLSGRKMGEILTSFDRLANSMRIFGEAFADGERTKAFVKTIDRLNPLVENLNKMSVEIVKITSVVNKKERAEVIIGNLAEVSRELQKIMPELSREVPDIGQQMGQIVKNLNVLTTEFQKLTPAIGAIAPELPRTSRRAVEALDETVVLLKALQRSFLLRGKVEEVKEEEQKRAPANTSEP